MSLYNIRIDDKPDESLVKPIPQPIILKRLECPKDDKANDSLGQRNQERRKRSSKKSTDKCVTIEVDKNASLSFNSAILRLECEIPSDFPSFQAQKITPKISDDEKTERNEAPLILENSHLTKKIEVFPTYSVKRTESINVRGRRTLFQLSTIDSIIYSAKYKIGKHIPISNSIETHINGPYQYILVSDNNLTTFSLRRDGITGEELMVIRYFKSRNKEEQRESIITINDNNKQVVLKNSDKFKLNPEDEQRIKTKSIKNAVYSYEGQDVMWVFKVEKNVINIESHLKIPNFLLFAIGISSFISKVNYK